MVMKRLRDTSTEKTDDGMSYLRRTGEGGLQHKTLSVKKKKEKRNYVSLQHDTQNVH